MSLALLPQEVRSAARGAWHVFGDYSLADPPFLVLAPLVLLVLAYGRARAGRARGRVSVLPLAAPRSLRQRLSWVPPVLQAAALLLVVVGLARPLRGNVVQSVTSEGVDIALVLDRSSSMRFDDLERGKSRLEVVKDVVGDFAERRMTDRVGASDNVGLITFARYPTVICPYTLDSDALLGLLEQVEMVRFREEDGTGIGVALAKAVATLRESEAESRIVVLLTDGENNVHEIEPLQAAELAAEERIKVYTVFAARYSYVHDPFRGGFVPKDQLPDTSQLEAIAELTGGRYYEASDRAGLEQIYAEIEELERTPRREERFEETFDLYLLFVLPGLALYGAAWLSHLTWARRVA